MPLSPEEIERITRSVVARLGKRTDPETVQQHVRQSLSEASAADTAQLAGSPSRQPMPAADLPDVTPMTAASSSHVTHPEIEPADPTRSRVIVATFGRNRPGVVAALTTVLAENNCDIADITQKILQEFFSMIMIVDIANCSVDFAALRQKFAEVESRLGVTIVAQHEDVFRAMHRV